MQESGKGTANGSGGNMAISADRAEELAASFRPTWDIEEPDATTEISGAPVVEPAPAPVVVTPVIMAATAAAEARATEPSSEAIEPEAVLTPAWQPRPALQPEPPAPAPAPILAPAKIPASTTRNEPIAMKPMAKPVAFDADPFRAASASASDIAVPKKSRGVLYAMVGLGVAAGIGLILKLTMAAPPSPAPAPTTHAAAPHPTKEEIPPPPPKDETPPTAAAKAKATDPVKAPEPKATPTHDPPSANEPAPKVAAAPPAPRPRAPAPAAAPAPPAPKAEPKTLPKATSGVIVRDNPF